MVANPDEEKRVRGILAAYGLPENLGTFDFGDPPPGAAGAYYPQRDSFVLPVGADEQTVIHEGAHAEHYHAAGIAGERFPADRDTAVGALIFSEAFVGYRLVEANGFIAFERSALAKFPGTAVEIAEQFVLVPGACGNAYIPGDITTTMIFRFLQRILPLVVAEVTTTRGAFTAGLTPTSVHPRVSGTGALLLFGIQYVLGLVTKQVSADGIRATLINVANMQTLGAEFKAKAVATKVL